jgi:hypothetical protein
MFQALLTGYYLCDAAAAVTLLDYATVARCIVTYQSVKAQFLSEEELAALNADPLRFGGEHGRVAYLRFTEWEEQNADLVAEMKAEAEAHVAAAQTGL